MARIEEFVPQTELNIDDYTPFLGRDRIDELKRLAEPLAGKGWSNLNSTAFGGGVAEMLQSLIPIARSLGLSARWYIIQGNETFFRVTKKFHNMLQGVGSEITLEEIFDAYLDTIDDNARDSMVASDLVVVHDPQPAALIMNGILFGNVLWRCHIDTSAPNKVVWRFLLPYINHCAGAIFSMRQFVGPGLQVPIYRITPGIDPLSPKNHQYTEEEALEVMGPLFKEHDIDPERPILAAISRYDIHKNQAIILAAFKRLQQETNFDPPPYLIFLGNTAADDPEGQEVLESLKQMARQVDDVRFWVNVPDNDRVVGALMRLAKGFVHISTKEGFGLVVTEALWQGTPVIGSNVGGIAEQVIAGRTGYLVDPLDAEAVAGSMARVLENPDEADRLGRQGREHVRDNFLLTEVMRRYLILLRFYTGVSRDMPEFRLDDLSYAEIIQRVRSAAFNPYLGAE